jgi:hypothetical protein
MRNDAEMKWNAFMKVVVTGAKPPRGAGGVGGSCPHRERKEDETSISYIL